MAIQQTMVGLERTFQRRAIVVSRSISNDDVLDDNESSWLQLQAPFPIQYFRVHNRARDEQQIDTSLIESVIQSGLSRVLPSNAEITRDVAVGAMYRDDLPVSNAAYANQYIVVSLEGKIDLDIPLMPRDPEVRVEMYFGLLARDNQWRVAQPWYYHVSVDNVGPVRRRRVREAITSLLTRSAGGGIPGEQIRDGISAVFNIDGIRNWYVIPGDGRHNSDSDDVLVRSDASFFYVQ